MQLLEEYKELIERDSRDISVLWKIIHIFLYFTSAMSGYCCAIIFYIFWMDIFGGHCPLWGHAYMMSKYIIINSDNSCGKKETVTKSIELDYDNWLNYIIVRYDYEISCQVYYFVSLCSCIFGIIWIVLFSICGKGGYDTRIIVAPWRIVMPALFFNFISTIVTMYAAHDLEAGFTNFRFELRKLFSEVVGGHKLVSNEMMCDIMQKYVEISNLKEHNICNLYVFLEILTWVMAWSWTIGLIVLIMRVLMAVDFRLLKVMIYEIPYNSNTLHPIINVDSTSIESEGGKEKQS